MTTVLVVDDSAVDRKLAVSILGHEPSWTIEEVENGRDALARLKQGGIDIVVTDMMMPDVNGLDLIDRMQISRAPMPVVLMTGQGTEVLAMQALQKGATSYVPKRMLSHWLVDTIKGASVLPMKSSPERSCWSVSNTRSSASHLTTRSIRLRQRSIMFAILCTR